MPRKMSGSAIRTIDWLMKTISVPERHVRQRDPLVAVGTAGAPSCRRQSVGSPERRVQLRKEHLSDLRHLFSLKSGQRGQKPLADDFSVARCGHPQRLESLIGEDREPAAPVLGAQLAADLAGLFQAAHGMGDPAGLDPVRSARSLIRRARSGAWCKSQRISK